MRRALALLLLAGCGTLPELLPGPPDGGHTKVPGTYHDARISPGHRSHLALSGDKQLACRDCHFISDAGFNAAAVKPCAACHEKQLEHHHPFDGGVAMNCFSCHGFLTTADKWGCAGCHVEPKEGAPHVTVHVEKCESCHRPHGAPFTRAADCGQCHDITVTHGKGERALPADTCMACHPHHTEANVAVKRCTGCHVAGSALPKKAQVKAGALFKPGHTGCATCHANHAFTKTSSKGCSNCHAQKPVLAAEQHVACITCHQPHDVRAAPKTCESCHTKAHVEHPPDAKGRPCLGCHPVHSEGLVPPAKAVPCLTCHQEPVLTAAVVHGKDVSCAQCHKEAHAGKPQRAGLCESCHETQHAAVKKNAGHAKCEACHQGLPHAPQEPKPCLSCHEQQQPPQKGHDACESCHASHSAQVLKKCTDCHKDPLPGLHAVKKHQKCESCHAPHTPEPGFGPKSCKSCHATLSKASHPTPPQQCASCHLFTGRK